MPENGQVRSRWIFQGTVIMPRCKEAMARSSFPSERPHAIVSHLICGRKHTSMNVTLPG